MFFRFPGQLANGATEYKLVHWVGAGWGLVADDNHLCHGFYAQEVEEEFGAAVEGEWIRACEALDLDVYHIWTFKGGAMCCDLQDNE